jgi:hypothetical protein
VGQIVSTQLDEPKRFFGLATRSDLNRTGLLSYSYVISGTTYVGTSKRKFSSELEAEDFFRGLAGQAVAVSYNLDKPSSSVLLDGAVEDALARRPPFSPNPAFLAERALPAWLEPLLGLLALVSLIGLLLSLWVHIGALFGRKVAPEYFFWGLHAGIFVVWIPAVFIIQKRVGYTRGPDVWKKFFEGAPDGLRSLVYFFGVYAFVNFALFMIQNPMGGEGDMPAVWRGFSGHWMAFYSAALAIFLAAMNFQRSNQPNDR